MQYIRTLSLSIICEAVLPNTRSAARLLSTYKQSSHTHVAMTHIKQLALNF